MAFSPRIRAPEAYEKLYTKDRPLADTDLQRYLDCVLDKGVTWNILKGIAEEYITTNNLSFDTNAGGSSLNESSYLYAHTISSFGGTQVPETVIYVGISGGEKIPSTVLSAQFNRASQP